MFFLAHKMNFNWTIAIIIFFIVAIVGAIIAFIVIYELNSKQHVSVGLPITIASILILVVAIIGAMVGGRFARKQDITITNPETTINMTV